ncbi:DMT family transporter [Breoghania sp.]|uniref:DMT family transporter n=1 Tax=Breoghania sp. TaxID=2065378 RepID=UPI0029CA7A0E|nr:DMT family transporter [Breoghania sp.]
MPNLLGPILIFIASLSWSTAGLFTRVVTTDIPTTLFWRSFMGGLCVLAITMFMRRSSDLVAAFRFNRGEVVIASLSTAGMICFISSFFYTSIANVSFVYGTMPLATYALSLLVFRETPRLVPTVCCLLAANGVAVMSFGNTALNDYLGIALALGMTFFMAALTVATKFFPSADTLKATYLSAFLGALIMFPFTSFQTVTSADYAWLWLYGLVNVGLGFGIYLLGVGRVTALAAALIGLAEIPLAPIWAWMLFGETVNSMIIFGGLMILTATIAYLIRFEKRMEQVQ